MDELIKFVGEKPSGSLYHYTSSAGLIGIVQNRQLWATDYRHLNDRKEYRVGAKLLQDELRSNRLSEAELREFHRLVSHTQKECFVLSFSERGDQLSQWRAYCPGGNGYSLGFTQQNELFSSAKQHSFNLVRCEYNPERQKKLCQYLVQAFMEGIAINQESLGQASTERARWKVFTFRYNWNLALALAMSALKHRGFEEEREWRLVSQYPEESLYGVSFRPGRFGVTPFFELPFGEKGKPATIDEIVIGPSANRRASRAAIDLLLSKTETAAKLIRTSRTPLRH